MCHFRTLHPPVPLCQYCISVYAELCVWWRFSTWDEFEDFNLMACMWICIWQHAEITCSATLTFCDFKRIITCIHRGWACEQPLTADFAHLDISTRYPCFDKGKCVMYRQYQTEKLYYIKSFTVSFVRNDWMGQIWYHLLFWYSGSAVLCFVLHVRIQTVQPLVREIIYTWDRWK